MSSITVAVCVDVGGGGGGADFYPVFRVVDLATGEDFIYEEQYMLKVIAVTDSPTNPPRWFSQDEIIRFNNMNQSVLRVRVCGRTREGH